MSNDNKNILITRNKMLAQSRNPHWRCSVPTEAWVVNLWSLWEEDSSKATRSQNEMIKGPCNETTPNWALHDC
ncbi:hypothetical protein BELL_0116g00100 [Botrytis elliptica]|uniref:Uncharacterized protein n=1 Tax=Botrytis elliptica TaxID=278938 RepID=A0A4Z1JUI2_9HELO|nr:hypothetical protein BELL_0116g00100 [Botrytis elliptica]